MRRTMMAIRGILLCGILGLGCVAGGPAARAGIVGFEDVGAALGPESYWNGEARFSESGQEDGTFSSGSLTFHNHYEINVFGDYSYPYWDGFAYSNRTNDPLLKDLKGQYQAVPGRGADDSATYGIGYAGAYGRVPTIDLPDDLAVVSLKVTNTNYAYYTMLEGDPYGFTDAFKTGDWFLLTITGKDSQGNASGRVDFYLADYRSSKPADHYIVAEWTEIDLSDFAEARSLQFTLSGSDMDPVFGLNTPAFFALDDIQTRTVPEPASALLLSVGSVVWYISWRRSRARRAGLA